MYILSFICLLLLVAWFLSVRNLFKKTIVKLESEIQYYKGSHRKLQNYNDFIIDLVCQMDKGLDCAEAKEKLRNYVVEELNIEWKELQERHDGTYYNKETK